MKPDDAIALAEEALAAAHRAGARSAEAYVSWERSIGCGIEGGKLKSAAHTTGLAVGLRVLMDGRLGRACGPAGALEATARAAVAGALPAPRQLRFAGVGGRIVTAGTFVPDADAVVGRTSALLEAGTGLGVEVPGGGLGRGIETWALATSEGFRGAVSDASASCSLTCLAPGKNPGTAHASAWRRTGELPLAAVANEAATHALGTRDPRPLDEGTRAIVFHPDALSQLFEATLLPALDGGRHHRRESPFATTQGALAAADVLVREAGPVATSQSIAPFDDEGVVYTPTEYLAEGRLVSSVASREDDARYGLNVPGWALRSGGLSGHGAHGDPAGSPGNLVVDAPRAHRDELFQEAKRGLYVLDILGAHTANPTTGQFAVEATTAYLLEGGALGPPVAGALLGGTLVELLRGLRLATEPAAHPDWGYPGLFLGHALVEGLRVTARRLVPG